MSGTRKTANSHRPSSARPIQGSNDAPGAVAKVIAEGVAVEVVTLLFRCRLCVLINRGGGWGKNQIGYSDFEQPIYWVFNIKSRA